MNRDPSGREATRDPIFLLQSGTRQWTQIPDGCEVEDGGLYVVNRDELADWILPFVDEDGCVVRRDGFWELAESIEGDHGWPLVYVEWRTESVWLTRDEAEAYAKRRAYRWDRWRVYCVCCEGALASLLRGLVASQVEFVPESEAGAVDLGLEVPAALVGGRVSRSGSFLLREDRGGGAFSTHLGWWDEQAKDWTTEAKEAAGGFGPLVPLAKVVDVLPDAS